MGPVGEYFEAQILALCWYYVIPLPDTVVRVDGTASAKLGHCGSVQ